MNFQLLERKCPPEEPLFLSRNHRLFEPSTVRNLIVKTAKNAGIIKPVSPHWMRHAHASHSMDHGAPLHVVQVTLGHSSPATLAYYLHVRPGDSSSGYLRFYPQF
ncbi:MAG: tyrosine-type recombinase/integrase [Deltaproteobacteria bacterium]|nr:tyrosine-type recombinase/integrase [Deltaproteobacteria bacterium]